MSEDMADELDIVENRQRQYKINDLKFVRLLETHGAVLLNKSQTPSIKLKKRNALKLLAKLMPLEIGTVSTPAQICKKIQNMKHRIKDKISKGQAESSKFTEAENVFKELMEGREKSFKSM